MRQPREGQRYGGTMTAGATGGLECSLRRGCVANTARSDKTKGAARSGAFLSCDSSTRPGAGPLLLWIEME